MKLSIVESPLTSLSILLKKKPQLQQDIFEKKHNWDRKVKNREFSKRSFWVYYRELHANAKFEMTDYSKTALDHKLGYWSMYLFDKIYRFNQG